MTASHAQIHDLLQQLSDKGYFIEWLDASNQAFYTDLLFKLCCHDKENPATLIAYGKQTAERHLTLHQLLSILHELTPLLDRQQLQTLQHHLQAFAEGFIQVFLPDALQVFSNRHADTFYNLDEQKLLRAHQDWLIKLFTHLHSAQDPKAWTQTHIDHCPVLQWLHENRPFTHPESEQLAERIEREDRAIHQLGLSLMLADRKADHFGKLLMLTELFSRSYFLQGLIRQLLNNERRASIYIDALTGLYNRLRLLEDLNTTDFAHRYHRLMLISLRHMKEINALYGLEAGDKLLQQLAHTLRQLLKRQHLYRLYADEFVVPLTRTEDPHTVLQQIQDGLRQRSKKNVTLLGSHGRLGHTSLGNLLLGMQVNKQHLSPLIDAETIPEETLQQTARHLELEDQLYQALAEDRIVPWFQPIMNLHTGEIEHYEALMRIVDREGRIIHTPGEFLPVLKTLTIYHEATLSVLHKTFQLMEQVPAHFGINLSTKDIENPKTAERILSYLENRPTLCKRLTFELLESEAINDFSQTLLFINRLKLAGVKIALDDFGSGYSNFNYLFEMPLDTLKVDGSLITALHTPTKKAIVEAILSLADKLNLKTIAEFVRDDQTLEQVRALGFDFAQGYAIGKPIPAQALLDKATA